MSMVHRQRAVLLQFPLVIYLAALLKCSSRRHWLTNQTVKPQREYQRKRSFKNICFPSAFWTMSCAYQLDEIDSCLFVVYKSRSFLFSLVKEMWKKNPAVVWQQSIQLFICVGTADQHRLKSSPAPCIHRNVCLLNWWQRWYICVSLLHELYCECLCASCYTWHFHFCYTDVTVITALTTFVHVYIYIQYSYLRCI